jgi:hypothetical protein
VDIVYDAWSEDIVTRLGVVGRHAAATRLVAAFLLVVGGITRTTLNLSGSRADYLMSKNRGRTQWESAFSSQHNLWGEGGASLESNRNHVILCKTHE